MKTLHINVRDTLLNNEKTLLNAYIKESDRSTQNITTDFTQLDSSGVLHEYKVSKSDSTINGLYMDYEIDNYNLHVLSNECVQVTYKLTLKETSERYVSSFRSSIWIRVKDHWKLNFHQISDIKS